jgi:RNA polymerase sigma factor (sigma-70 family)
MAQLHVDDVDTRVMDVSALEDDEHLLLQRLAQGDRAAFWGIWERYRPILFSQYCLRWMGGNREEAEDALSSACLKAWEHLPTYAWQMTNVKSWLIRLVYNHCMDIRRTYIRHARIVQDVSSRSDSPERPWASTCPSPEDIVCGNDVMKTIHQAMDQLPLGLRQTATLRFFRDMPYAEIADHLELSPENARKRVQQARSMLKLLLHGCAGGDAVPTACHVSWSDSVTVPQRTRCPFRKSYASTFWRRSGVAWGELSCHV